MANLSREQKAIAAAFLANFIFGLSFMFSKKSMQIVSVFTFLSYRFTFAFIILTLILLSGKIKVSFKNKPIGKVILLGLIQPVCYFLCESYGISMSTTCFAGVIIAIVPVTTIIAGSIFLNEKPTNKQIFFSVLSIIGVAITTIGESEGTFSFLGMLLLLGAVISASLYCILNRSCASEFTAFERTYIMCLVGSAVFTVLSLIQNRNTIYTSIILPLGNLTIIISILYLSLLSSVCAFLFLNYALTYLPVAKASIFTNVTTVVTIFAGILFLNEAFNILQLLGCITILISVYFVNKN